MAVPVSLKHNTSGVLKEAPIGFSWTTLFFTIFPALFRGDLKWTFVQLLLLCVTFGASSLVMPFVYNKIYVKNLLESGYVPADDGARDLLAAKGIMVTSTPETTTTTTAVDDA